MNIAVPRSRHPRRLAALIPALIPALALSAALAGCSDDGNARTASSTPTAPTSTAPSSTAPTSTPPTDSSGPSASTGTLVRLVAERSGGRVTCVAKTARGQLVTLYDPIAQAAGDLTVTRVRVAGYGARLVAAEGVLVTANPAFGPGAGIGDRWPVPADDLLRRKTDLTSRHELKGMELADGDRVLPLIAVRATPPAVLDGLQVEYQGADGRTSEVTLPVHTRFATGRCPGS